MRSCGLPIPRAHRRNMSATLTVTPDGTLCGPRALTPCAPSPSTRIGQLYASGVWSTSSLAKTIRRANRLQRQSSLHQKKARQSLSRLPLDDGSKDRGVQRRLRPHIHSACAMLPRPVNEAGRWIDRARSADDHHQCCVCYLLLNALPLQRNFAKEDDVRSQPSAAYAAAHLVQAAINRMILNRRPAAILLTMRFGQLAVHVQQSAGAGPLVQVIHILRAEKKAVAELLLQLRKRKMRRIRLGLSARLPPSSVELPNLPRTALPGLRRAHILNPISRPQPVRGAKGGQPALRADARPG